MDIAASLSSEEPDALPCETDQAQPDRLSHDWHVQPVCQRSFWTLRLSGVLSDRGPDPKVWLSPNLLRRLDFGHRHCLSAVLTRTF